MQIKHSYFLKTITFANPKITNNFSDYKQLDKINLN